MFEINQKPEDSYACLIYLFMPGSEIYMVRQLPWLLTVLWSVTTALVS